jgi:anti-sigma-K factor RskA
MNCDEVHELLPAYVLGALEPEEVTAVEAHLRGGHEHEQELVELRATVFALDRYAADRAPSRALAERAARMAEPRPRLEAVNLPRRLPPLLASPAWRALAAAVALLFVFGAGWLAARAVGGNSTQEFSYVIQGPGGEVVGLSGESTGDGVTVTMAGLDPLPAGSSYQLWAVRDDRWLTIGVCNTDASGGWVGWFPFPIRANETIALTAEPEGGSTMPTSVPLLQSTF